MVGKEPFLPVDVVFGFPSSNSEDRCTTKYINAYRQAQTCTTLTYSKQKWQDIKARAITLEEGDRILVKKVVYDADKFFVKWEDDIHVILARARANDGIPVNKVRHEDGEWITIVSL